MNRQGPSGNQPVQTYKTQINFITNEELDDRITALWKTDFPDSMNLNKIAPSIEDKKVLDHLEKTRKTSEEGTYLQCLGILMFLLSIATTKSLKREQNYSEER